LTLQVTVAPPVTADGEKWTPATDSALTLIEVEIDVPSNAAEMFSVVDEVVTVVGTVNVAVFSPGLTVTGIVLFV
jgi:hypothetical protein